jgi:hypothetical protein
MHCAPEPATGRGTRRQRSGIARQQRPLQRSLRVGPARDGSVGLRVPAERDVFSTGLGGGANGSRGDRPGDGFDARLRVGSNRFRRVLLGCARAWRAIGVRAGPVHDDSAGLAGVRNRLIALVPPCGRQLVLHQVTP